MINETNASTEVNNVNKMFLTYPTQTNLFPFKNTQGLDKKKKTTLLLVAIYPLLFCFFPYFLLNDHFSSLSYFFLFKTILYILKFSL